MTRRTTAIVGISALGVVGILVWIGSYRVSEYHFDAYNLRLRYQETQFLFPEIRLWSKNVEIIDHEFAEPFREAGIIGRVNEEKAKWMLIKALGYPHLRGVKGQGARIISLLTDTTFGNPVPLPTEARKDNFWLLLLASDPDRLKRVWSIYIQSLEGRVDYYPSEVLGYAMADELDIVQDDTGE